VVVTIIFVDIVFEDGFFPSQTRCETVPGWLLSQNGFCSAGGVGAGVSPQRLHFLTEWLEMTGLAGTELLVHGNGRPAFAWQARAMSAILLPSFLSGPAGPTSNRRGHGRAFSSLPETCGVACLAWGGGRR